MYQPQHQHIGIRNGPEKNYLGGETLSKKALIKLNNYIDLSKSKRAKKIMQNSRKRKNQHQ